MALVHLLAAAGAAPSAGATAERRCACPSLSVQYINLGARTDRAAHMEAMLQAAATEARREGVGCPALGARWERLEAVRPLCARGHACTWEATTPNASAWGERTVYKELEGGATRRFGDERRAGALGAWLSHLSAFRRFSTRRRGVKRGVSEGAAAEPRGAQPAAGGRPAELLLLLDDDVALAPRFFAELPCLLQAVPEHARAWHALRLSTWGARDEEDRIEPPTGALDTQAPRVYRARAHPYDASRGPDAFPYGGVHATLVQRSTVNELLEYLLANRAMPIDVALRESQTAAGTKASSGAAPAGKGSSEAALHLQPARSIRSLVLFTDLVGHKSVGGSWRRASG